MVNMYNVFSWQRVAANLHENECHEEKLVIYKPSTMSKKSGRGLERTAVDVQDSEQMCQGGKLKEAPGQRCVWQRGQKWYGKPSWWPIPKYHWTFLLSSFVIHIWSYLPDFARFSSHLSSSAKACRPVWAKFYVRFAEMMKEKGLSLWGFSVQWLGSFSDWLSHRIHGAAIYGNIL